MLMWGHNRLLNRMSPHRYHQRSAVNWDPPHGNIPRQHPPAMCALAYTAAGRNRRGVRGRPDSPVVATAAVASANAAVDAYRHDLPLSSRCGLLHDDGVAVARACAMRLGTGREATALFHEGEVTTGFGLAVSVVGRV